MKRILGLLIPASVLGAAAAASGYAYKAGWISPAVWFYLWPSLVALAFLALGLVCLFMGLKIWLWPTGAGFLVQATGLLLLLGGTYDRPIEALQVTLIAVGIVLFIMLVVWLIVTLRARWLEKKMLEGVGGEGGLDAQELQKIRNAMRDALALLKRAGRGRNAIYELPWFPVIGRAKAGKTVAIKNSGLSLPVRKDWVKGIGGTHTLDFFFTPEVIFLDTPGEWTSKVIDEDGRRVWLESLRLLRKYRGRRPLDGLVVVVPADDLLSRTEEELQDQAGNIREVIDLMQGELKFRFPVYVLVSKCDLVDGFVDFFRGLPAQRRHEILGWSHDDPNEARPARLIPQGFRRVLRRLEAYRLEMLARIAKKSHARRLFFFTENFRRLQRPLSVFTDILFLEDPANEPPVFRGFYFTSGTQGEGAPMGEALSQLARNLGVRVTQPQAGGEEEPKRSYFLLELFRTLMVGDEGLVSRTAMHWWRRRRDTLFVAFLPAGVAVFAIFMSLLSYTLNAGIYRDMRDEVPRIVERLREYKQSPQSIGLNRALDLTDQLRQFHKKLDGFNVLRRFGMRRPGQLRADTLEVFDREFRGAILDPTLEDARAYITNPEGTCADRMDVFYSLLWLRQGQPGESLGGDLQGLPILWAMTGPEAEEPREKMLEQFRYLKQHSSTGANFLTKLDLANVAQSVKEACSQGGAMSALSQYLEFQRSCADPPGACEIVECHDKLTRVLEFQEKSFGRMLGNIERLREYLRGLKGIEPGAEQALAVFGDAGVKAAQAGGCQKDFDDTIVRTIATYSDQDALIEAARQEWKGGGGKPRDCAKIATRQIKDLDERRKAVTEQFKSFNTRCIGKVQGFARLEEQPLLDVMTRYRRVACMEQEQGCGDRQAQAPPAPGPAPRPGPPRPRPPGGGDDGEPVVRRAVRPSSGGLVWLSAARTPGYTSDGWSRRKGQWADDLQYAKEDLSGAEKQSELDRIHDDIDSYAQQYVASWQDYLESLDLKAARGAVPLWLEGLATTPEFRSVLLPAAQALQAGERESEPPFDVMKLRTQGLSGLTSFVEGDLNRYQAMLKQIAVDLKRCGENQAFWSDYRSKVANEDTGNPLVQAMRWVDSSAGPGLAGGRLRALFAKPLEEARNYLRSSSTDLTAAGWKGLNELFSVLVQRYPFAGADSAPLAEEKDLQALLGGKSGLVQTFHDPEQAARLSSEARAWVDDASELSSILFLEGDDKVQSLRLKLTFGEPVFDPEDFREKYKVEEVLVYFGGGLDLKWKPGDPTTIKVDLPLFGKEASEESLVKVTLAERKGAMGRAFSKENFGQGAPQDLVPRKGPWAALRLIAAGLPPEKGTGGLDRLALTYTAEVPYKKNAPAKIKIPVTVEGKGLARLLSLMEQGLRRPPNSASAGSP
jgi:hypothetical protein